MLLAHCLTSSRPALYRVVLGAETSDFERIQGSKSVSIHSVVHAYVPETYNNVSLDSDIGVIGLGERVDLTQGWIPVCLPVNYNHDSVVLVTGTVGEVRTHNRGP